MGRRVGGMIYDWNEPLNFEALGIPEKDRFFGVELELDDGKLDNLRYRLSSNEYFDDKLFLVEDGSLSHRGIEIVTQPMGISLHIDSPFWDRISTVARQASYQSHDTDTCGLHIHVSRNDIPEEATDRLAFIMERFWDEWVVFSRRKEHEMRRWSSSFLDECEDLDEYRHNRKEMSLDTFKDGGVLKSKYKVINLIRDETIEFRFFKGTTRVSTIKACIELVDALMDMATDTSDAVLEKMTWEDLLSKFEGRSHLTKYISSRGLDKSEDKVVEGEGTIDSSVAGVFESVRRVEVAFQETVRTNFATPSSPADDSSSMLYRPLSDDYYEDRNQTVAFGISPTDETCLLTRIDELRVGTSNLIEGIIGGGYESSIDFSRTEPLDGETVLTMDVCNNEYGVGLLRDGDIASITTTSSTRTSRDGEPVPIVYNERLGYVHTIELFCVRRIVRTRPFGFLGRSYNGFYTNGREIMFVNIPLHDNVDFSDNYVTSRIHASPTFLCFSMDLSFFDFPEDVEEEEVEEEGMDEQQSWTFW